MGRLSRAVYGKRKIGFPFRKLKPEIVSGIFSAPLGSELTYTFRHA